MGYRYYETRYEDTVLGQGSADSTAGTWASTGGWNYAQEVCFPFGFGLSYITYEYTMDSLDYDAAKDVFTAAVTVKNTGPVDGKASVQLYFQSPYTDYDKANKVEKSAIQLLAYDKVKVAAGASETVKLEFLNEQEAGLQGVSTCANEQSIREIYMRAFEGALGEGDALGVMTAYNRIGVMYAAANLGIQHILRDEWNYGGYIIDDALSASAYSSAPEMLMAGTNIFCLDTARPGQVEELINQTDDGDLIQKVLDSNRYLYYIMLQSSMGTASAEDLVVTDGLACMVVFIPKDAGTPGNPGIGGPSGSEPFKLSYADNTYVDKTIEELAATSRETWEANGEVAYYFERQYTEGFGTIVDPACLDMYCCKDGSMYGSFSGPPPRWAAACPATGITTMRAASTTL